MVPSDSLRRRLSPYQLLRSSDIYNLSGGFAAYKQVSSLDNEIQDEMRYQTTFRVSRKN